MLPVLLFVFADYWKIIAVAILGIFTLLFAASSWIAPTQNPNDYNAHLRYWRNGKLLWYRNKRRLEVIGALGIFLSTIFQFWVTENIDNGKDREIKGLQTLRDSAFIADLKKNSDSNFAHFQQISAEQYDKLGYKYDSGRGEFVRMNEQLSSLRINEMPEPIFDVREHDVSEFYDEKDLHSYRVSINISQNGAYIKSATIFFVGRYSNAKSSPTDARALFWSDVYKGPVTHFIIHRYESSLSKWYILERLEMVLTFEYSKDKASETKVQTIGCTYNPKTKKAMDLSSSQIMSIKKDYSQYFDKVVDALNK